MNKITLTKELAVSEKLHLSTAAKAVDGIIRIIAQTLATGEDVTLRGFGTFTPVMREPRTAIDFATKQQILVPAHRSCRFKLGKELKQALNCEQAQMEIEAAISEPEPRDD